MLVDCKFLMEIRFMRLCISTHTRVGNFLSETIKEFKLNLMEGEHLLSEAQFLQVSRKQAAG